MKYLLLATVANLVGGFGAVVAANLVYWSWIR